MNYFNPYPVVSNESIVAAWNSQVAQAEEASWLAATLTQRANDLFPHFAACYAQLRALPRGARRALQRQLARSQELAGFLPELLQGNSAHALQQKLARSLAGAALLLALGQGVAQAGIIFVTPKTAPGIVYDANCSITEAIVAANSDSAFAGCPAGSGADTIVLPKGTQSLTSMDNSVYGPTGLPVITSDITIEGDRAKITRGKNAPDMRLMAVGTGGSLTLNNVTLSGGMAVAASLYTPSFGGAIFNYMGNLQLNRTTITGNKADFGGGIFNSQGVVNINNSTVSKNSAAYGGGLINFGGYMRVDDSIITGNKAFRGGGGAYNTFGGALLIDSTTISKNSAMDDGGGLWNRYGTTTVANSIITGNKAGDRGGGALNVGSFGNLIIDFTTISKNSALNGGGLWNRGGYIAVQTSIISKNTASANGGGLWNGPGYSIKVDNSTITGNKAGNNGGGAYNYNNATLLIDSTTISKNSAKYGGGVCNIDGDFLLSDSTVAGNKASVSGGGVLSDNGSYGSFVYINTPFSKNKAPNGPDIAYSF